MGMASCRTELRVLLVARSTSCTHDELKDQLQILLSVIDNSVSKTSNSWFDDARVKKLCTNYDRRRKTNKTVEEETMCIPAA
mmetsp:Transcript_2301/g.5191  ORF Transcript_2301/g.5191 Transcript_2301/m.5191 type:complete len:82 (-) Transcript_2301:182-427(-)